MELGAARIEITPDQRLLGQGVYLTGFVRREGPARGVLHPIHARVIVARSGERTIVLVSLELLELTVAHVTEMRGRIGDAVGVGAENVCIGCTHTHYAPAVFPLLECGEVSAEYRRFVDQRVVQCACRALANVVPVRLVVGDAPLDLGCNRRAALRADKGGADGLGPRDTRVRVLGAADAEGRWRVVLFHHACHMVSMPAEDNLISGDIAGVAGGLLEAPGAQTPVAMFLTGCSGDINPHDRFKGAVERTESGGRLLAESVRAALAGARIVEGAPGVGATWREVALPTAPPDPDWARKLREVEPALEAGDKTALEVRILRARRRFLAHRLAEVAAGRYPPGVVSRIQRLELGPLTILALSDEVFFEIGQEIVAGKDPVRVWPVAYANGGCGYVCTSQAHRQGGYEPVESNWFYNRAPLSEASAAPLIRVARQLLSRED